MLVFTLALLTDGAQAKESAPYEVTLVHLQLDDEKFLCWHDQDPTHTGKAASDARCSVRTHSPGGYQPLQERKQSACASNRRVILGNSDVSAGHIPKSQRAPGRPESLQVNRKRHGATAVVAEALSFST